MASPRSTTLTEFFVIAAGLIILVFMFHTMMSAPNKGEMVEAEGHSLVFSAILGDEKGRTVPAVITVRQEDVPKLVQGGSWRILINTDDPRWNREE